MTLTFGTVISQISSLLEEQEIQAIAREEWLLAELIKLPKRRVSGVVNPALALLSTMASYLPQPQSVSIHIWLFKACFLTLLSRIRGSGQ
jgi:hypothetical protein